MDTRPSAVAGQFYEADPAALRAQLERCFLDPPGPGALPAVYTTGPRRIVGLVCPHAGLMYSGYAAAHAYLRLAADGPVDTAVLLCPNHHGLGSDNAVWPAGAWETPFGSVSIEETVARELCAACPVVHDDTLAHAYEHAIEVQLPFLQMLYGVQCTIVPITMKRYILEDCLELGKALAQVLQGRNAVVIASSDFSHYEPAAQARRQDAYALEAITRLDPEALFARVEEHHISTCGYGPVAVMLAAARGLGANSAEELAYTNSGDINGDTRRVVGYAAVAVTR